ncbi:hypothetical protein OHA04_45490 (plasmid) [Streptomyces sp. NBC_01590]|uniref:hypothetical protein n=1 Tax=Streptomyces sp. NBC_01590 TaxID=2975887 RepID=UPI002F91BE2D
MTALLAAALLFAAGYGIGRWRPWRRLADWTNWQMRFHADQWTSWHREATLAALLLATDTRTFLWAWRHRHDPRPGRSPAVEFRTSPREDDR